MGRRDPSPPPHTLHRRPSYSRQTKIDSDTIFANELACTENLSSSDAISAAKRSLHGPHSATWHPRSRNVTLAGSSLPTLGVPAVLRCTPSPPSSSSTGTAKEWAAGRVSSSSGGAQVSQSTFVSDLLGKISDDFSSTAKIFHQLLPQTYLYNLSDSTSTSRMMLHTFMTGIADGRKLGTS
jgi:hypothetical protein